MAADPQIRRVLAERRGGRAMGTGQRAAFTVTFDFTGTAVPNQIIYGLAFNTQTWGYNPIGAPGPYVSLNFGLSSTAPSVGSNPFPDTAYWKHTQTAGNYADGDTGGVGIFRRDTNWTPFSGAVSLDTTQDAVTEVPALSPFGLFLLVSFLALIAVLRLRSGPGIFSPHRRSKKT